jgi:cysteinyl-tRNA synthetase
MQASSSLVKEPLLRTVSRYVLHILKSFGVYGEDDTPATVGEAS